MRKLIYLILIGLCLHTVNAQDVHFSQMKFAPLSVNPALAGLNGKYNAVANFRTQWNSVADPFTTMGASFDMIITADNSRKGYLAGGINLFHDIAGDMKMTTTNANLNLAYHIRLNAENTFGLGVQGGYASRGLGRIDGLFGSQYDGEILNPDIISGENFRETNQGYFDVGAGLVYNHNSIDNSIFNSSGFALSAGIGAYHLTRPNYSYLQGGKDDLAMRFIGFVDADFSLNERWGMMPAIYYQRQGSHQEILVGTYFKYNIYKASSRTNFIDRFFIAYGAFYRVNDAFVNKLLIDFKGYALGISYDINLSSLTQASKGRGGMEFVFRYTLPEVYSRTRIN